MKKNIAIMLAISVLLTLILPITALAAPTTGIIDQNLADKEEIIPGGYVSKYYYSSAYYAFPITVPKSTWGGEVFNSPARISSWEEATGRPTTDTAMGVSISFGETYNGTTTSEYHLITYDQMYAAYSYAMRGGYPLSDAYLGYGLTEVEGYYATNFVLQRLSNLFNSGTDNGAKYHDNGTTRSINTARYAWDLEQGAKKLLKSAAGFSPLQVTYAPEFSLGTGTYEGYLVNTITIRVPEGQDINNYSAFTGYTPLDYAHLPVSLSVDLKTMSKQADGSALVSGVMYIPISSCKGGEIIKFSVGGQAKSKYYGINVYRCAVSNSESTIQYFLIGDRSDMTTKDYIFDLTTSTHQIKVPNLCNLTVESVAPNKSEYEAEENGIVSAVIKNSGQAPVTNAEVRLSVLPTSTFTITNPNTVISYLAPGESKTVTWNVKSGALATDTTGTFTAAVDPNNKIAETNENDNSKTASAMVYRLKPDLVVESVLTNKEPGKVFEAGETIVITAVVRNVGKATAGESTLQLSQIAPDSMQLEGFDQSQQPLPNPTFDVPIGALAPGGSVSATWRFVNPIRIEARNVDATATADVYNAVQELREDNNTNSIKLTLNPGKPDFTPVWHNVLENQVFKAGYEAVISAKIRNIGKISSDRVNIRLHINGKNYSDIIDIPTATPNYPTGFHPAGGNIAAFRVRMPDVAGAYTMTVTADPTNTVDEEREDNNVATIRIVVKKELTPPVIEVADPALEDEYTGTIPEPPDIPYKDTNIWEEIRKIGDKKYEVITYYATLSQEFVMKPAEYVARADTPNEIESGFGLEGSTVTYIETNYDRPNLIVGSQIVRTYYPETNYGNAPFLKYHEKFQAVPGGNDFMRKWVMKVNPTSVKGYAVHYTPKWFPDGTYSAISIATCSFTPAGQITNVTVNSDVKIVGDMYDRITSGNR